LDLLEAGRGSEAESFEQRVTLVTGASSGIGYAVTEYFAERGSAVVMLGRTDAKGVERARDLAARGCEVLWVRTDVRNEDEVTRAFAVARDRYDRLDVVVNCAGVQFEKPLHEIEVTEWDTIIETNLRGYFLVSKHAVRSWLERKRPGALVHISSALGLIADDLLSAYSVTKGGQILLSHSLAVAYGPYGIRSNVVCPGSVATESFQRWASETPAGAEKRQLLEAIYPQRRITQPEEVAAVVYMLASDEAGAVSGATVSVDGAFGVMSQHNVLYSGSLMLRA
jgi:NAD(P)-dependent dehydrogenase (short-subunit alcohol dehydrogenase family)